MNSKLPSTVAIITGDPSLPDPTKFEHRYCAEDLAVHKAMEEAFASIAGLESQVFEQHHGLFERLREYAPDLVVNFCDTGLFNRPEQEIHVVTQLEMMGLPYTGAPPRSMLLCFDKQVVRLLAESMGIPVAREQYVRAADIAAGIDQVQIDQFPVLIKPNAADGSVGITKDAVAHDMTHARAYLAWLANELPGKDILIQEYLSGPEYGLGMLGNPETGLQHLPMLEVDFSGLPAGLAPILSFESKAQPDSPYWTDIRIKPASLNDQQQEQLAGRCRELFGRLSLRDYGRFDFRAADDGTIKLMEVNPNPAWGNDAKLALMAGIAGWSYADLMEKLVAIAWARVTAAGG